MLPEGSVWNNVEKIIEKRQIFNTELIEKLSFGWINIFLIFSNLILILSWLLNNLFGLLFLIYGTMSADATFVAAPRMRAKRHQRPLANGAGIVRTMAYERNQYGGGQRTQRIVGLRNSVDSAVNIHAYVHS